jgi:hypothetical protein
VRRREYLPEAYSLFKANAPVPAAAASFINFSANGTSSDFTKVVFSETVTFFRNRQSRVHISHVFGA